MFHRVEVGSWADTAKQHLRAQSEAGQPVEVDDLHGGSAGGEEFDVRSGDAQALEGIAVGPPVGELGDHPEGPARGEKLSDPVYQSVPVGDEPEDEPAGIVVYAGSGSSAQVLGHEVHDLETQLVTPAAGVLARAMALGARSMPVVW
ncbi:hypothetical protein [Streptomyces kaempferi]|uniref:Uncharacterized protein n=1 Tax=Streptomyces kaempferi TaxID=333725 RepID=A0ABW3XSM0_9ACTN